MSELSIRILRQQVGQIAGTWKAMSVQGTTAQPKLYCECTLCGANQTLDINAWHNEQLGRPTRCLNFARHPAPKAVAPKSQELTIDVLNRMPADEYKRRFQHEAGFRERAEYILTQQPKPLDRRQAIEAQENRDREARRAPHRKLHQNAFWAYTSVNEKPPFKGIDAWIALPADVKAAIIKRFDLENQDWKRTF